MYVHELLKRYKRGDRDFRDVDLAGTGLAPGTDLAGADLTRANLSLSRLHEVSLKNAILEGTDLKRANLHKADLQGADLRGADLRGADLRWANLQGADLTSANLRKTIMQRVNLTGANLAGANLTDAVLDGADLSWANLLGARVDPKQLTQAASLQGIRLQDDVALLIDTSHQTSRESGSSRRWTQEGSIVSSDSASAVKDFWSWLGGFIGGLFLTIFSLGCGAVIVWMGGSFFLLIILIGLTEAGVATGWRVLAFIVWLAVCTFLAILYTEDEGESAIAPGIRRPPPHIRLRHLPHLLTRTPLLLIELSSKAISTLGAYVSLIPRLFSRALRWVLCVAFPWIVFVALKWVLIALAVVALFAVLLHSFDTWLPNETPWAEDTFGTNLGGQILWLLSWFAWLWVANEILVPVFAVALMYLLFRAVGAVLERYEKLSDRADIGAAIGGACLIVGLWLHWQTVPTYWGTSLSPGWFFFDILMIVLSLVPGLELVIIGVTRPDGWILDFTAALVILASGCVGLVATVAIPLVEGRRGTKSLPQTGTSSPIDADDSHSDSDVSDMYYRSGLVYADHGLVEQAIADFDRAIDLNPAHAAAHYSRAIAYLVKGERENAWADFETVLALSPEPNLQKQAEERLDTLAQEN